jgi:serine protease Do
MIPSVPAEKPPRGLAARPVVLLAVVAGIAAVAGYAGSRVAPTTPVIATPVIAAELRADNAARPVGFAEIVERVKPAVFGVRVRIEDDGGRAAAAPGSPRERSLREFGVHPNEEDDAPRQRRVEMAQGSGFFISSDGYAVTSDHVLERSQTAEITTDDGSTYTARLIGTDAKTDLAVIKIDGRNDFPYVRLGDGAPRIGDWVLAIGNPFGLGGTVTAGIVSAHGRDIGAGPYSDFIQIDAPVNQGNSGGPTFDVHGKVIGVNTAIFSPSGGSIGIAFAVPAETVKTIVGRLKDKGAIVRGWIGVQIQPVTAEIAEGLGLKKAEGALVAQIDPGGPAAKAGIVAGDVITSINAEPLKDNRDLSRKIGDLAPGTQAKFAVVRGGKEKSITVTLGELPGEPPRASVEPPPAPGGTKSDLGLTLMPGKIAETGHAGVIVLDAASRGGAAGQGIETGDVILEVGGKAVKSPADFDAAIAAARRAGKHVVMLRVQAGETSRFVAVRVG